jgi:hypothetical protein
MRLDRKPVPCRTRTLPSTSEGDRVAVSGIEKAGTMEAIALRNLTSGAICSPPAGAMLVAAGVVLIVLGIPLIVACGIGLVFIAGGLLVFYKTFRHRAAIAMVQQQSATPP